MGWVGDPLGIVQKFEFDLSNRWYLPNLESLQENKMDKFLWDFEIKTDHLISARRPNLMIVKKKRERAK